MKVNATRFRWRLKATKPTHFSPCQHSPECVNNDLTRYAFRVLQSFLLILNSPLVYKVIFGETVGWYTGGDLSNRNLRWLLPDIFVQTQYGLNCVGGGSWEWDSVGSIHGASPELVFRLNLLPGCLSRGLWSRGCGNWVPKIFPHSTLQDEGHHMVAPLSYEKAKLPPFLFIPTASYIPIALLHVH